MVYGDIGTSPLYAPCAMLQAGVRLTPTPNNVYGILSLIVWSLTLVVSVKYIVYVMRADNRGEGWHSSRCWPSSSASAPPKRTAGRSSWPSGSLARPCCMATASYARHLGARRMEGLEVVSRGV